MPTTRYISSKTPTWHYEPKPSGVYKLMFLCADGQLRIGCQKGWLFGRDYVAWMPLPKYDKRKFNAAKKLYDRFGKMVDTDGDWRRLLENSNV